MFLNYVKKEWSQGRTTISIRQRDEEADSRVEVFISNANLGSKIDVIKLSIAIKFLSDAERKELLKLSQKREKKRVFSGVKKVGKVDLQNYLELFGVNDEGEFSLDYGKKKVSKKQDNAAQVEAETLAIERQGYTVTF